MSEKYTIEVLQEITSKRDGLGKYTVLRKYKNDKGKQFVELKCSRGHVFSIRIEYYLKNKINCQECKKLGFEKFHREEKWTVETLQIFSNERYGIEAYTILRKYQIKENGCYYVELKCNKCGNTFSTRVSSFINGSFHCKECEKLGLIKVIYSREKYTIEYLQSLTDERDGKGKFTVLRKYYDEKGKHKVELKCNKCNNIIGIRIEQFLEGNFLCRECLKLGYIKLEREEKWDIDALQEFSDENYGNGKYTILNKYRKDLNSPTYIIEIMCDKGHVFYTSLQEFIKNNFKCPQCDLEKRKETFLVKLDKVHHGKYICLNIEDYGKTEKLLFECTECGHVWESTPSNILQGYGCPNCWGITHINETNLYKLIKELFPQYTVIREYRVDWLTNRKKLDIVIKELNIAIEYQVWGHFGVTRLHDDTQEKYEHRVQNDLDKYRECQENGMKLFYFSHERNLPSEYIDTIYTDEPTLLDAINEYIKTNPKT